MMISPSKSRSISVVLLAGGIGTRTGADIPKQFLPLGGIPIVLHSFHLFTSIPDILEIVVVCDVPFRIHFPDLLNPRISFAMPGERRQDSVWNGFCACDPQADLICIHDGARPLLVKEDLLSLLAAAREHRAAALAVPVKQTIKQANELGFVENTLDHSNLWEMHTPQVIASDLLRKGFEIAAKNHITVTDDVALIELLHHPVKLVRGEERNLKVTTPIDLTIAETLLTAEKS
ncbi:MAG: 2-C-methyl-D-erythritol 4-phosphate cytidylyltransferase [Simkania sp.]|nr:2-C-methyl-D-erythritol 4-phosphate cytidylyltransferase [Simkania sp.]